MGSMMEKDNYNESSHGILSDLMSPEMKEKSPNKIKRKDSNDDKQMGSLLRALSLEKRNAKERGIMKIDDLKE